MKKIFQRWRSTDWHIRVIVAGFVVALVSAIIVMAAISYVGNKSIEDSTVTKGKLLSYYLADLNMDAFKYGRADIADISFASNMPYVEAVYLYDGDGRIIAPFNLQGDSFNEMELFRNIARSGKLQILDGGERTKEMFEPVISPDSGGGRDVIGVVHLRIKEPKSSFWGVKLPVLVFLVALFGGFIYLLVSETRLAFENVHSRRFDMLTNALERAKKSRDAELMQKFEAEWRKLIHALERPVFIMDSQFKIVEMNEEAIRCFKNGSEIREGKHIVDIVRGSSCQDRLLKIFGRLEKNSDPIVRDEKEGSVITAFASNIDGVGFKYAVICSEMGG